MTNAEVSYNWNGQDIRFNQWAPNAYGVYEYTSRNRRHYFRVDIQPAGGALRLYILDQPSTAVAPRTGTARIASSTKAGTSTSASAMTSAQQTCPTL